MPLNEKSFLNLLKNYKCFENKPHIAVGVSGGPDSMALVYLLNKWIKLNKGKLIALIFDHEIRSNSKEESLDSKVQNEIAIDQLNKFLDEIPENFRMAVVLRDFQELSYEEISKILEIPIGTIKSRINRGRIQLAEKMKHFKE